MKIAADWHDPDRAPEYSEALTDHWLDRLAKRLVTPAPTARRRLFARLSAGIAAAAVSSLLPRLARADAYPLAQPISGVTPCPPGSRCLYGLDLADDVAGVDLTHLPLGDGHVAQNAQVGSVWACVTGFGGGGAQLDEPWIHSDGTYDLTAKVVVSGAVDWPSAFNLSLEGDRRLVTGNGLPDHPTGQFPISPADAAYQYDRNPNAVASQELNLDLPAMPAQAETPSCLPMGPVGVLLSGALFFNALDAGGRDAVAHELQDGCQGHPQVTGVYHYHSLTPCLSQVVDDGVGHSPLVGYAFDGFGIFGRRGESGEVLTSAGLDECHGHTHVIEWDGQQVEMYHYHATWDYPYTIGCYRGTPAQTAIRGPGAPPSGAPPGP